MLAIALLGWFALVSPQRSKAADLETKITESQTALQLAEALNRGDAKRSTAAEVRQLAKAMPDEARMSQILRQLSWAATRTHVRVNSVTPQAAAPLAGYEALPMTVVVEGRYLGIANFLGLLRTQDARRAREGARHGTPVQRRQRPVLRQLREQSFLQATMTINAYRFGGAVPPATAPAATPDSSSSVAPATTPDELGRLRPESPLA